MRRIMFLLVGLFIGLQAFAQTSISGTVTDSNGEPVPGANVRAKGYSDVGTITDLNGSYTLNVPTEATTLVVSFVGMKTSEVEIAGQTVINVTLENEDVGIDEVVVTALGVTKEKKALGYNVQEVGGEDLQQSTSDDVVKALSGRTAGVNITSSSGSVGSASYITIRGASSITGNNSPLFIIDGQPISSGGGNSGVGGVQTSSRSIDINPNDIESVSVLKGGAASALYGVRAANGVIMITTKKGKNKNKLDINFNSSFGFNNVSKLPERQEKFAQGTAGNWVSGSSTAWGPKITESSYSKDPSVWANPEMDVYGAIVPNGDPLANSGPVGVYDPYDFFQTGYVYDNNLSVSNGNENSTYYFSIGNRAETGIVPNEEFNRTSVRLNATSKLAEKWKTGANVNYVFSKGNFIQKGSNVSGVMLGLLRTPPSFDNSAGYKTENGGQRTYRGGGGYDNPYWTANENYYKDKVNRFIGSAFIDFDANDWLSFTYRIGIDAYIQNYTDFLAVGSNANSDGHIYESGNYSNIFNSDFIIKFNKTFGDIGLSGSLGNNMRRNYFRYVDGETDGPLDIPTFHHVKNTSVQKTYSAITESRTAAYFIEALFSWKDMLYIGATGRYEWATTMPEDNLSAFYPSVNLGFVFTELPALQNNGILSFGKFRTSYAKTANIAGPYNLVTTYAAASMGDGWTTATNFPAFGATGFTKSNTLGSSDLTHENMISFEIGGELRFLNNRIGIEGSYYLNKNSDLLLYVPIAASSGYTSKYTNAASMQTEGAEFTLFGQPVKTGDFTWDIMANFTKERNVVTELAPGVPDIFLSGFVDPQIRAVAGLEYRTIFGNDWYRDEQGRVIINDDPAAGQRLGYPMVNAEQGFVPIGNVNPDWTANITNTFSYKGIRLSFLIDIKKGGNMYNGTRFAMNNFGTSIETINREVTYNPDGSIDYANTPAENLVTFEGVYGHIDENGNVVTSGVTNTTPVVLDQTWYQGFGSNFGDGATTAAIEDAGWIRLREVTLSYSVAKSIVEKTPFNKLEVYFTGTNLWLSTPYRGIDPETSLEGNNNGSLGMDYFNMPGKKTFMFGLRIGL